MEAQIYQIVDYKTGKSNKGDWHKITYIVQADNFIVVTSWGADADLINKLKINDLIEFDLEIKAREWQGKWYNEVTARNVVSHESNNLPDLNADPPKRKEALEQMDKKAKEEIQGTLDIGTEDINDGLPF